MVELLTCETLLYTNLGMRPHEHLRQYCLSGASFTEDWLAGTIKLMTGAFTHRIEP